MLPRAAGNFAQSEQPLPAIAKCSGERRLAKACASGKFERQVQRMYRFVNQICFSLLNALLSGDLSEQYQ